MASDWSTRLRAVLVDLLDESLTADIPMPTRRTVEGRTALPGKATVVVGMRRAGKTWFLHQLRRERLEAGWPRERLPYLNLEDERLAGIPAEALGFLVEEYYRRYPRYRRREEVMWCFDEIQGVAGWERFVRRLLDTEKVNVVLTGSSAALLSREIATSMRGRAWEVTIFPFSFEEFLRHRSVEAPREGPVGAAQRSRLEHEFRNYLRVGGFPEAQALGVEDRRRLLTQYVDVAVLRDVIERHQVRNTTALRWMVRHLLSNPAGRFSVEKFHRDLKSQGLEVGRDTLHDMLAWLEDCFLVRISWLDTVSERRRMVHARKVYPVDPGLIEVFSWRGGHALGHALESAVRVELERRGARVGYGLTEEGYEIDLVARWPDGRIELIQTCAEVWDPATWEREIRALTAAAESYPAARRRLITLEADLWHDVPEGIEVVRAWEWFLARPQAPRGRRSVTARHSRTTRTT